MVAVLLAMIIQIAAHTNTYQVNLFTTECQLLSLPADFDKSECLSESGWSFYERIHDCPYYVLPDTASAGKSALPETTLKTRMYVKLSMQASRLNSLIKLLSGLP